MKKLTYSPIALKAWSVMMGGIEGLSKRWPEPRLADIQSLTADESLDDTMKAAWEAREIVLAQDRAPNITGLFAKKLRELS